MDEYVMNLGGSPLRVPRLGVGVMTWGKAPGSLFNPAKQAYGGPANEEAEAEAFRSSLKAGVSMFDTAEMYSAGASELRLGELAKEAPEALIASKFPPGPFVGAAKFTAAFESTLARLGRTHIDLFQHHFPSSTKNIREVIPRLGELVLSGLAKAVGVSNYSADQMRLAHRLLAEQGVPLASNQVQYSLIHRKPESNGVMKACRELKVTLIAYQPLASGALTGKYSLSNRPKGLRRFLPPFGGRKTMLRLEELLSVLRGIAETHGRTPAQVALRWLLENPIVLPIPGAKDGAQAEANAEALRFRLSPDEMATLNQATVGWL